MRCPTPIQLEALVDGELPPGAAAAVAQHIEGCPSCAEYVDQTRRLVALLRQAPTGQATELDVLHLVESVRRRASRRLLRGPLTWRQAVAAAAVVLLLGAGAATYRVSLAGQSAGSTDPFAQALLTDHQAYAAGLAADPDLNVQVAVARQ